MKSKVEEYLKNGKIAKLNSLKKSAKFLAIERLSQVWGIGPVKA